MIDLEEDPFLITSWEDYCQSCLNAGQLWRFRKALSEYIWITNRPAKAEIRAYCVGRHGDWAKEDLLKGRKKDELD